MKKWLRIVTSFSLIIFLSVAVTFAWMLQSKPQEAEYVQILYGKPSENKLIVAPKEIEMSVYTVNEADEYVPAPEEGFTLGNILPGSVTTFRIRLRNTSMATLKIRLSLMDIEGDSVTEPTQTTTGTLLDMMFISIRGGIGYLDGTVDAPSLYKRMSLDCKYNTYNNRYSVDLLNALTVPPTENASYVELNCYFYLDPQAGNEYQNKTLNIGTFRAEK